MGSATERAKKPFRRSPPTRGRRFGAGFAVGALLLGQVLVWQASARAAGGQAFAAEFTPPGVLVPGQPVSIRVYVDTPTFDDPAPEGTAYVRGAEQGVFTVVPLRWDVDQGVLAARVPAAALSGRVLEEYVIVSDPASGESLTVPPAGKARPYRSWIVRRSLVVRLAKHRFGHTRDPDAIVARAKAGDGAGEVGFRQPAQGPAESPTSFGIAPNGDVWVLDERHERLLGWETGHPRRPVRTIPLDFGAADLAVGPDGTIYVSGTKGGDSNLHLRLYAFAPDGHQLWMGRLLSETFNTQVRVGTDGVVYGVEALTRWTPATTSAGRPLRLARQAALSRPYEPLAAGGDLVVVSTGATCRPCPATPAEARVALTDPSGNVDRSWRLQSGNDSSEFDVEALQATPTTVEGDPLIVFAVYDYGLHLLEHQVVLLSPSGITRRFSVDRGWWGSEVVTGILVGPDGDLYQLQTDPSFGLRIARYSLAPSASPSPTPLPTTPSPTRSPVAAPSTPSAGGASPLTWVGLIVATAAAVIVPTVAVRRRRRGTRTPPTGA